MMCLDDDTSVDSLLLERTEEPPFPESPASPSWTVLGPYAAPASPDWSVTSVSPYGAAAAPPVSSPDGSFVTMSSSIKDRACCNHYFPATPMASDASATPFSSYDCPVPATVDAGAVIPAVIATTSSPSYVESPDASSVPSLCLEPSPESMGVLAWSALPGDPSVRDAKPSRLLLRPYAIPPCPSVDLPTALSITPDTRSFAVPGSDRDRP